MTNSVTENLYTHYNKKYAVKADPKKIIPLVSYPKDRFQATVKWAGSGDRLLEIGAGSGVMLKSIRSRYRDIYATELSQPRIEELREKFQDDPGVKILHHDIERETLPFPADYFDTILFVAVVEHLVNPLPTLCELRRVLKKGGKLLIDTPNFAKWTCRVKLLLGYFPSTASKDEGLLQHDLKTPTDFYDDGHLHYFTYRSLRRVLLERTGFSQVFRHGFGPFGPLCQMWPTLLSDDILVLAQK